MIGIVRIQCDIFAISFGMRSVFANLLAFKNYHKLCEIILTGGWFENSTRSEKVSEQMTQMTIIKDPTPWNTHFDFFSNNIGG